MVKRISMVRRREGMSREDFVDHWLGPHADIVRTLPGLRGYVVSIAHDPEAAGWDGMAEVWFDAMEDVERAFAEEPARSLFAADRPLFVGDLTVVFVDEHVVVPQRGVGG